MSLTYTAGMKVMVLKAKDLERIREIIVCTRKTSEGMSNKNKCSRRDFQAINFYKSDLIAFEPRSSAVFD